MRTLVYDKYDFRVYWNHSATFNVYTKYGFVYKEVDMFTCYDCDLEQACKKAEEHIRYVIFGEEND